MGAGDFFTISTSNSSMKDFNPDKAIDLWWQSEVSPTVLGVEQCLPLWLGLRVLLDDSDPETKCFEMLKE